MSAKSIWKIQIRSVFWSCREFQKTQLLSKNFLFKNINITQRQSCSHAQWMLSQCQSVERVRNRHTCFFVWFHYSQKIEKVELIEPKSICLNIGRHFFQSRHPVKSGFSMPSFQARKRKFLEILPEMTRDIRNVHRGQCQACGDCEAFISVSGRVLCDYCGCPPAQHENLARENKKSRGRSSGVAETATSVSVHGSIGKNFLLSDEF